MEARQPNRKTVKYIDPAQVKKAARVQTAIGIFVLIFSGVVLYSLPANFFYIMFLVGSYFFFSGILITLSIVSERTSRNLAKYLVAYWIFNLRR